MVVCQLISTGIRKEKHLGVGVDGEVELDGVLVATKEVGHSL